VLVLARHRTHNVGAIMRSAAPSRQGHRHETARSLAGGHRCLAKFRLGALELVPLVIFSICAETGACADRNERQGFLTVGLDSQGHSRRDLGAVCVANSVALGVAPKQGPAATHQASTCGVVARLESGGEIKSLNVSKRLSMCWRSI